MPTESDQVNLDETNAASSTAQEQTDEKQTAAETSATATTQAETKATKSLEDTILDGLKAHGTPPKPDSEVSTETAPDGEGAQKKDSGETEAAESTEKKETKETQETEPKGPVPYERFEEVNEAKKTAETRIKEYEPFVSAQQGIIDACRQNNISPEQFSDWLHTLTLVQSNPAEALKKLAPIVEQLQGFTGDKVDADLQKDVDNSELSLARAQELTRLRKQSQFGEQRHKLTLEQQTQLEQGRFLQNLHSTFDSWLTAKSKLDPDFQKSKDGKEGKFELFMRILKGEINPESVKSPADLVKLAETAYTTVGGFVQSVLPKRNGSPHVRSNRSSTTVKQAAPKSMEEAVEGGLQEKYGINVQLTK